MSITASSLLHTKIRSLRSSGVDCNQTVSWLFHTMPALSVCRLLPWLTKGKIRGQTVKRPNKNVTAHISLSSRILAPASEERERQRVWWPAILAGVHASHELPFTAGILTENAIGPPSLLATQYGAIFFPSFFLFLVAQWRLGLALNSSPAPARGRLQQEIPPSRGKRRRRKRLPNGWRPLRSESLHVSGLLGTQPLGPAGPCQQISLFSCTNLTSNQSCSARSPESPSLGSDGWMDAVPRARVPITLHSRSNNLLSTAYCIRSTVHAADL